MALWLTDTDVREWHSSATADELQLVMQAVYNQVLGNFHCRQLDTQNCHPCS